MTSQVDSTFPADNVKTDKSGMRAQMLIIKDEITALQAKTGVAGELAFNDRPSRSEVQAMINFAIIGNFEFARKMAFGDISL